MDPPAGNRKRFVRPKVSPTGNSAGSGTGSRRTSVSITRIGGYSPSLNLCYPYRGGRRNSGAPKTALPQYV
jgi:hypothetical protein